MKSLSRIVVAVIIAAAILVCFRYHVIIHSPIVAKVDRLTGDVWIVNSGVWKQIQMPVEEKPKISPPAATTEKAK